MNRVTTFDYRITKNGKLFGYVIFDATTFENVFVQKEEIISMAKAKRLALIAKTNFASKFWDDQSHSEEYTINYGKLWE